MAFTCEVWSSAERELILGESGEVFIGPDEEEDIIFPEYILGAGDDHFFVGESGFTGGGGSDESFEGDEIDLEFGAEGELFEGFPPEDGGGAEFDEAVAFGEFDELVEFGVGESSAEEDSGLTFGLDDFVGTDAGEDFGVDGGLGAADDSGDAHFLDDDGGEDGGLEVFADGDDADIDFVDALAEECVGVGGIEADGDIDEILDLFDESGVAVHGDDLNASAGEIFDEGDSETAEADDRDFIHGRELRDRKRD